MPETGTRRRFATLIPALLTGLRALLAPVVAMLALFAPNPTGFAACLVAAFVSDIFDGIIARRLGVATATLRRLDSAADTLFYAACIFAAWHLFSQAIADRATSLALLVALEIVRYVYDYAKFRREASYHAYSAKLWGIALFAGFMSLLVFHDAGIWVTLVICAGIVADVEGLAISIVLRRWRADVPSLAHALRLRRSGSG